jgi:hypothetical protein
MDVKRQTDLIFLDFSKAFDRVSHQILVRKLGDYFLNPKVIAVIKDFLTNRTQKVVVEGVISSSQPVTSGVPQGSVLGPLLFLIYINDLCQDLDSKIRLFADDTVLYREILSPEDHKTLQCDLDKVLLWCRNNEMSLNAKKCNVMSVCRLHVLTEFAYTVESAVLERVQSYKYLGIYLSSDLSWNNHVDYACSRANRALGFVRRQLGKCSTMVKLKAYTTLVRPHLEYASAAWDPNTDTHIAQIEMVQHRAARFILSRFAQLDSVTGMLRELELETLKSRRRKARLSLFYKIVHKITPLVPPNELNLKSVQRRTDNGKAYEHFACHTNPLFSSFYPRTVRDWNLLPSSVVSVDTIDAFCTTLERQRSDCL